MRTREEVSVLAGIPRWIMMLLASLLAGVSLITFHSSFAALRDLAIRAGTPAGIAWEWPVMVDGLIVLAMLVIFVARIQRFETPRWAWFAFLFFSAVSIAGNGLHASIVYDNGMGLALPVAIFMGALPPFGLLVASEMFVYMLSHGGAPVGAVATQPDAVVSLSQEPAASPEIADSQPWPAVAALDTVAAVVAPVATPVVGPDNDVSPVADTVAGLGTREITGFSAVAEPVVSGAEEVAPQEPVAAVATPDAAPDTVVEPVATEIDAVADTAEEVAPPTRLHAVESIPADPAGQVEWIVSRAKAGRDVRSETLSRLLQDAGQVVSDRTVQRRIAAARELAPEVLEAAG